jgi:hypothetical protein
LTSPPRFAVPAVVLVTFGLVAALASAPRPARAQEIPEKVITSIKAEPVTISQGGTAEARVAIRLAEGHRILADPVRTKWLTGATLVVDSADGLVAKQAQFPEPTKIKDKDSTKEYPVWSGTIEVTLPVAASPKAAPGKHVLNGRLRYQVVYEGEYYKVAVRKIEIPVKVVATRPAPSGG